MKKILLIGDSIRKGYDAYVRERMANLANVYFPEENCTFTTNILRFLHVWTDNLKLYEADAVHFNAGASDGCKNRAAANFSFIGGILSALKCVIYIYDCVRSRHYGELIRDLQNLGSSR